MGGVKLAEDPAREVRFVPGEVEARRFYTAPIDKGGLGRSAPRFDKVDFRA